MSDLARGTLYVLCRCFGLLLLAEAPRPTDRAIANEVSVHALFFPFFSTAMFAIARLRYRAMPHKEECEYQFAFAIMANYSLSHRWTDGR